jgi:hypothetical protein
MSALKALVRNGRIVVDEPTDLPEGTELELVTSVADDDDISDEDRRQLDEVLRQAHEKVMAGHTADAVTVLTALGFPR